MIAPELIRGSVVCLDAAGWPVSLTNSTNARRAEKRGTGRYFERDRVLVLYHRVSDAESRYRELQRREFRAAQKRGRRDLPKRIGWLKRIAKCFAFVFDAKGRMVAVLPVDAAVRLCDADEGVFGDAFLAKGKLTWNRHWCVAVLHGSLRDEVAEKRHAALLCDRTVRMRLRVLAAEAYVQADPRILVRRKGDVTPERDILDAARALSGGLRKETRERLFALETVAFAWASKDVLDTLKHAIHLACYGIEQGDPLLPVLRALPAVALAEEAGPRREDRLACAATAGALPDLVQRA